MRKLIVAAALLACAFPAFAQQPPAFKSADKDGDGVVSPSEMKMVMPDMTQAQWDQADADKSGGLSETEYMQMMSHQ